MTPFFFFFFFFFNKTCPLLEKKKEAVSRSGEAFLRNPIIIFAHVPSGMLRQVGRSKNICFFFYENAIQQQQNKKKVINNNQEQNIVSCVAQQNHPARQGHDLT